MNTFCGIDCNSCQYKKDCNGCVKTKGQPLGEGGVCPIAKCCLNKEHKHCGECMDGSCSLKGRLMDEYNALGIEDMEKVTNLCVLIGKYVNLEYTLPNGQKIKLWHDNKLYLGYQVCKKESNRCYGLTADENYLLVCEYGENGSNPEIVVYKKRR